MRIYWSNSTDPVMNFAAEQYLLKKRMDNSMILYLNEPCVVCGRLQIPYAEVNFYLLKKHNIAIYRRYSGGGTVYHDEGNLNFAFTTKHINSRDNYAYFNSIIVQALNSLGIYKLEKVENNIFCNGFKISGTAQYKYRDRLLHHGTLLIKSNLNLMSDLLISSEQYTSRCVKSKYAKVENVERYFDNKLTTSQKITQITNAIVSQIDPECEVTEFDHSLPDLAEYKSTLSSESWIFMSSPEYQYNKHFDFRGNLYSIRFNVTKGKIHNALLEGKGILEDMNLEYIEHTESGLISFLCDCYSGLITKNESDYLMSQLV